MSIDGRRFRNALGQFPTGVIVVTAYAENGAPLGMTMSSFNSVSLDPPLVLFSIHRESSSFLHWKRCQRYAINILGEQQEELSNRFARSKGTKWDGLTPVAGKTGVPLLPDALVAFECEPYATYDGGDHEIFVARVLEIHDGFESRGQPILFYAGQYRKLENDGSSHPAPVEVSYLHGW